MRAVVTGAGGFVGQWLCRELLRRGAEVTGAGVGGPAGAVLTPSEHAEVRWLAADVRRGAEVAHVLDVGRPDVVFHLAGVSFVPEAQDDPGLAFDVNVTGTVRLLAEVRRRRRAGTLDPVVLIVGSGEQYGRHEPAELPLRETAEQRPLTVYAASKAAQEVAALQACRSDGARVVATRSFNHSGPGQLERFLLPALVRRGLQARRDGAALRAGNLDPVRDFLHVADVVSAYAALAERGGVGEVYNVSSGRGRSVREVAEAVLRRLGVEAAVESDPALARPVDLPALVGDSAKLRAATGWAPARGLEDIIDDLIHAATQ